MTEFKSEKNYNLYNTIRKKKYKLKFHKRIDLVSVYEKIPRNI